MNQVFFPEPHKIMSKLLNLITLIRNETYGIHHSIDLKILTLVRLDLVYFKDHKFGYSFKNCINPLCWCSKVLRIIFTPITFIAKWKPSRTILN